MWKALNVLINREVVKYKNSEKYGVGIKCLPAAAAARGQIVCWTLDASAVSPHMQTSPPSISFSSDSLCINSSGSAV